MLNILKKTYKRIKIAQAVWRGAVYPGYRLLKKAYSKVKAFRLLGPTELCIYSILIYIFKYRKYKAIPLVKKGFEDHKSSVARDDPSYRAIFKRLVDSYNKAKAQQENIGEPYHAGKLWQRFLDLYFDNLVTSLRDKNTVILQALLENFHREMFTVNLGDFDYSAMKKNPLYKYQYVNTWYQYYNVYKEVTSGHPQLTYPLVGNPAGLYYDGQIIPIATIRYHYYAMEILSLLRDVDNPVVCDIGSGSGGQCYKILSNSVRDITCILLDIPEVLVIASYFLIAALPEKRILLYGEGGRDHLDSGKLEQYDIILMPNFMLPELASESVDLFFNACSFSEMDSETVREYIRQIERICTKYFMHINHTAKFVWYENGKKVVNMPANQIRPDPNRFKKIYQHPRVFSRLEDEILAYNYKARHFAYLYERIKVV